MIHDEDNDPLNHASRMKIEPQHAEALAVRERAEAIEGIRAGLKSIDEGSGHPAREFFADLRAHLGLPPRNLP